MNRHRRVLAAIFIAITIIGFWAADSNKSYGAEIEVSICQTLVTKLGEIKTKVETAKTEVEESIVEEYEEVKYTEEDLYVLSHIINGEAGGASWDLKIGVGSVVLNRVSDSRFPNTISGVAFQSGQYACTWDGNYDKTPTQESIDAARYLLENGTQFPSYVIFQSQFHQGDSVYKQIGNTYFCYYRKDAM